MNVPLDATLVRFRLPGRRVVWSDIDVLDLAEGSYLTFFLTYRSGSYGSASKRKGPFAAFDHES